MAEASSWQRQFKYNIVQFGVPPATAIAGAIVFRIKGFAEFPKEPAFNTTEFTQYLDSPNLRTVWNIQTILLSYESIELKWVNEKLEIPSVEMEIDFFVYIHGEAIALYTLPILIPAIPGGIGVESGKTLVSKHKTVILEQFSTSEVSRRDPLSLVMRQRPNPTEAIEANERELLVINKPKIEITLTQEFNRRAS